MYYNLSCDEFNCCVLGLEYFDRDSVAVELINNFCDRLINQNIVDNIFYSKKFSDCDCFSINEAVELMEKSKVILYCFPERDKVSGIKKLIKDSAFWNQKLIVNALNVVYDGKESEDLVINMIWDRKSNK